MIIYPLLAEHGDAIVIESNIESKSFRIVIDGGPECSEDRICDQLNKLGYIDLLILTHYDEDHIKGLLKYFSSLEGEEKRIGLLWTNCARIIDFDNETDTATYQDAYNLANYLARLQRKGIIGEWKDDICTDNPKLETDSFAIDILSPTPDILKVLKEKYESYIEEHGLEDDPDINTDVSYSTVLTNSKISLGQLAENFKPINTTFMNKSSIAILLSAEGKKMLFLGDASAKVIENSLIRLGALPEKPMHIDLVKLSHHGSKANISKSLFELIDSTNYLCTTNGGTGGAYHPDRTTLGCLYYWRKNGDDKLKLYFNYPLDKIMERNTGLLTEEEKDLFEIIDNYDNKQKPAINI